MYVCIYIYVYIYIYILMCGALPPTQNGIMEYRNDMEYWNIRILGKWNIGILVTWWFSLIFEVPAASTCQLGAT